MMITFVNSSINDDRRLDAKTFRFSVQLNGLLDTVLSLSTNDLPFDMATSERTVAGNEIAFKAILEAETGRSEIHGDIDKAISNATMRM
jgi:hypothetical protein